jgi:hypothetical protein
MGAQTVSQVIFNKCGTVDNLLSCCANLPSQARPGPCSEGQHVRCNQVLLPWLVCYVQCEISLVCTYFGSTLCAPRQLLKP